MNRLRGFSLVEVMVSMAVGMGVLLLAVAAMRSAGDGYGRTTGGVGAEREARAALSLLVEDLSKAVDGEDTWLVEKGSEAWRKDRLGFLCLQPAGAQGDDERIGDLCAVLYYVKDLEMGGDTVRCLMRGFRGSSETFGAMREGTIDRLFNADPGDEPISFGVLAFEATALERDAGGRWRETEALDSLRGGGFAIRARLVVARRELVGKLKTAGDWEGSPLLGIAGEAVRSKDLEVYEIIHPFDHES